MSVTVTTTSPVELTTSLDVPNLSEPASELDPILRTQALLDNDKYLRDSTRSYGAYTQGANVTWKFNVLSDGNNGETTQYINVTAACDFTLSNLNAVKGMRVEIKTQGSYALTVKNAAGSTLVVLNPTDKGEFIFTGTAWILWWVTGV